MKRVRLTEAQLHRVIKESVKRILKEEEFNRAWHKGQDMAHDWDEFERENQPNWLDEPKEEFDELSPEEKTMYTQNPEAMDWAMNAYKNRQMERDYKNYGNPNI